MPYIDPKRREKIYFFSPGYYSQLDPPEDEICFIDATSVETVGELNYAITKLIAYYLENTGHRYEYFNGVVGVLECAKMEMYSQLVRPYEEEKKEENGNVYQVSEVFKPQAVT